MMTDCALPRSIPACAGEPLILHITGRGSQVYPRVCGGTFAGVPDVGNAAGLSPRVRGNPAALANGGNQPGSIPACAGEPVRSRGSGDAGRVYPRVCGGTGGGSFRRPGCGGLSPRVRGNPNPHLLRCPLLRSIPACAGEPDGLGRTDSHVRVYPRVCGGTRSGGLGLIAGEGLSPRVRGNRRCRRSGPPGRGSIPACAGEPRRARPHPRRTLVYPRVCGGTLTALAVWHPRYGLSPRVRGNPVGCPQKCVPPQVYPRVCGGTGTTKRPLPPALGLSPRVRGNRRVSPAGVAGAGSIPACAGEPGMRWTTLSARWVYPRVCGGTQKEYGRVYRKEGLSPRVRGNPLGRAAAESGRRSIPACAGEPVSVWILRDSVKGLSPRVRGNL